MKLELSASCLPGMEELLYRELEELGVQDLLQESQAVQFKADETLLIRCLNECRCALRIFQKIGEFTAGNQGALERQLGTIIWDRFMRLEQSFAVESLEAGGRAPGALAFISLKVKDSIVDYFRKTRGTRPNVQRQNPDIRFLLVFGSHLTTLYREATIQPLSQRGYRRQHGGAPINEVLAWGILETAGFSRKVRSIPEQGTGILVDPMCGSGTFSIEAARYLFHTGVKPIKYGLPTESAPEHTGFRHAVPEPSASAITSSPPSDAGGRVLLVKKKKDSNQDSTEFACLNWPDLGAALRTAQEAFMPLRFNSDKGSWVIIAADRDSSVLDIARENARRAGVSEYIRFIHSDFENLRNNNQVQLLIEAAGQTIETPGLIVINPPYDIRLGSSNLEAEYRSMGDVLKKSWSGFEAHVFSAKRSALKQIGLRSSQRHSFKTGQLDAALFSYSLY